VQQDEVIAALEQGKASEFSWPSAAAFFNTEPPAPTGEIPRPPMPVGTASPGIK